MRINYSLSVNSLSEHLLNVDITVPAHTQSSLIASLPTWIPGSYMVRDFAKNLHRFTVTNETGTKVAFMQIDKQSWTIDSQGQALTISYVIYAFDLSVRSAYVSDEYAFVNGTSAFLSIDAFENTACGLTIDHIGAPSSWKVATSFTPAQTSINERMNENSGLAHQSHFEAINYDELIDHPILFGDYEHCAFEVLGTTFHMVLSGQNTTDIQKICDDLVPLCEHHIKLFGDIPCKDYWFLTLLADDGFGGLEHRASTALLYPRFHLPMSNEFETRSPEYQRFLSLCSHELLHTWHVKKSRPKQLVNPDLSAEVYTEQLWIYEGFTSLFDDLSLVRTGLIDNERYCQILSEAITRLLRTPGRHYQTVAESSFNAWTKFYKQDAGSVNHIVSYYNKGAVIALCLDITLRQLSADKVTLDTLMLSIWNRFGRDELGTKDDIIVQLCNDEFGIDIKPFLDIAVHTTMDLPLHTMLAAIGLKLNLRQKHGNTDQGGTKGANSLSTVNDIEFGAVLKAAETGITIVSVNANTAAAEAGLQVGDRLISLDTWQVTMDNIHRLLNNKAVGSSVKFDLLRQGRLISFDMNIRHAQQDTAFIEISNAAMFDKWLYPDRS